MCGTRSWASPHRHEVEAIPLLSGRRILDKAFKPRGCTRRLEQSILRAIPVVAALDPLCDSRKAKRVVFQINLGNGPGSVLIGVAADEVRNLLAQEGPTAVVLDLRGPDPRALGAAAFGEIPGPRISPG